jgi:hypothetical protein
MGENIMESHIIYLTNSVEVAVLLAAGLGVEYARMNYKTNGAGHGPISMNKKHIPECYDGNGFYAMLTYACGNNEQPGTKIIDLR